MSFLKTLVNDLKVVEKGFVAVEPIASTVLGFVSPGAKVILDNVTGLLTSSIVKAEQTKTDIQSGTVKSQTVKDDFTAAIQWIQTFTGKTVTVDDAQLSKTIDAFVAAFNEADKLHGAIKIG